MKGPSRRVETLPPSGIREVMALADTMSDVIRLEAGEPSFNTPEHIIKAAFDDARRGFTKYTPNAGIGTLRDAIAERHTRLLGRAVTRDEVFVSSGAVGALSASVLALVEDGDEVLVPDPGWPNYLSMVHLAGGRAVPYALRPDRNYVPDPLDLRRLFSARTKAIILNTPSNPTGAVIPGETLRAVVGLAAEFDTYVVSDEVYGDLVFAGEHISAGCFDSQGRVIVISGCSKTYAMTGWRLGWAVAQPRFVALMARLQEPLTSCASSISQRGAEAALRGPQTAVLEMRTAYHRRCDMVCDLLRPAGILAATPQGAFYAMVDLSELRTPSRELARELLAEERVATAPGSAFGPSAEGMLRISLATSENDLLEGCRRIINFVEGRRLEPATAHNVDVSVS